MTRFACLRVTETSEGWLILCLAKLGTPRAGFLGRELKQAAAAAASGMGFGSSAASAAANAAASAASAAASAAAATGKYRLCV